MHISAKPVSRTLPLLLTACCAMALGPTASAGEGAAAFAGRPNILWLTFEDSGPHLAAYGDATARTPNIDALAEQGIVFTQAFSVSGVCSASRAALITGMYPQTIGAHNHRSILQTNPHIEPYVVVPPPEVKCFSEYLRRNGYYCTNNEKCDYNFGPAINRPPTSAWDESSRQAHWRNRPEGRPFFAVFNFNGTHMFQLWKNEDQPLRVDPQSVSIPPIFKDGEKVRRSLARYYDNLMNLDEWVGGLLAQLEEDGLAENTIVFLFSDHGWAMPRGKIWCYDAGIRVPLIVRFPGRIGGGRVDDGLVSFVDLAPTVLSLTGTPVPAHLQGRVFLGPGETEPERAYVYAGKDRIDYHYDLIRAVRSPRHKYIRNYQPDRPYLLYFPWIYDIPLMQQMQAYHDAGALNPVQELVFSATRPAEELYDLERDPWETVNLAGDPAHAGLLRELRAANEAHLIATRDRGFTPETTLREQMWPEGTQPQTLPPVFTVNPDDGRMAMKCATEGASIVYQKQDAEPGSRWLLYDEPIALGAGEALRVVAVRYGYLDSEPTKTAPTGK